MPLGLTDPPSNTTPANLTFLFHLRLVCSNPTLGKDTSGLNSAVEAFANWLECEFVAEGVNLSDIDAVLDLKVSRIQYIKMCGDIAKHNLARLEANVSKLRRLLSTAGHEVDEPAGYRAIPEFFEWFENIFIYHASQIAEFLNNIRWEIYLYLQSEFRRSYHRKEGWTESHPWYAYHVPELIKQPVAYAMYWDAMNRSRSKPFVQRFSISDYTKTRY